MNILLDVFIVFLHGVGVILLLSYHRRGIKKAQNIFIINLSICELLISSTDFVIRLPEVLLEVYDETFGAFQDYMLIFLYSGVSFVYYLDMIFITLDRLLSILLSIRYRVHCTNSRAKRLIQVTWVIGLLFSFIISAVYHFTEFPWEKALFTYFFPFIELIFLILAVVTYILIFRKYRKSLLSFRANIYPGAKYNSKQFSSSNFYIPVLMISIFVVFMLIPDFVYLFYGIIGGNDSAELSGLCWVSYGISSLSNGYVYIFLQKSIRAGFMKRFCCCAPSVFRKRKKTRQRQAFRLKGMLRNEPVSMYGTRYADCLYNNDNDSLSSLH